MTPGTAKYRQWAAGDLPLRQLQNCGLATIKFAFEARKQKTFAILAEWLIATISHKYQRQGHNTREFRSINHIFHPGKLVKDVA
jgi:hypothetical protein